MVRTLKAIVKPQTLFKGVVVLIFLAIFLLQQPVYATAGINGTVNFQGKIVNKSDGTNITDNSYSFTFKFYDAGSGGNQLPVGSPWSETQTVSVTNGIFRATLGSSTPIPSTLDFNSDSIYLDITFNSETFGTRVRMTAVPYAFNAQKVGGLTVTNTTGTLTIPNGTTITFSGANDLTLTTTAPTTATLPSGTITLVDLASSQSLTSKTIGSTGLTFSGASTDITTVSNQDLAIVPDGSGKVGIGTTSPLEMLDVNGNASATGNLTLVGGARTIASRALNSFSIGDSLTGDVIFGQHGKLTLSGLGQANGVLYTDSAGDVLNTGTGGAGTLCLQSAAGGTPTWGSCGSASSLAWSSLIAPTTNLSFNMYQSVGTSFSTTFTYGNATGAGTNLFNLTDTSSNTGTGSLLNLTTAASSTLKPLHVSAAGTEAITVDASGRVGIGNTNPLEKLDVSGNATVAGNLTFSGLRTIAGRAFNDFNIGDSQTGNMFLTVGTGKAINFYSASNKIDSTGNLTLAGNISASVTGTINSLSINAGALSGATTLSMNNQLTNSYANSAALNLTGSGAGITFTDNSTHNIQASAGTLQINGLTITSSTGTLTIASGKTLTASNTLTFAGTDSTSFTFPSTSGGTVITTNQASQTISNAQTSGTVLSVSDTSLQTGIGLSIVGGTAMTTGSDLDLNGATYTHAASQTGNFAKLAFTDNTNVAGASTTNGLNISSTFNLQGASGAKAVNGLYVANPTINGCSGGTTCTWNGGEIDLTANTNTAITEQGLYIKPSASQNTNGSVLGIFIDNNNQGNAAETALKIGTGWDNGLDISSPSQISSTLTATGTTTIGSAGNTFTFNPASGPAYAGTARPYKIITLSPEYIGASLSTFYGAGTDSSNNTGTMTSDVDSSSNAFKNYYSWTSTTATPLQSYTVAVRVTLPQDFSAWCSASPCTDTNAMVINLATSNTSSANNAVDVQIYRVDSTTTAVYSSTNNVSSSGNAWTAVNIASTSFASTTPWNTAGQTATIFLRVRAMNSNTVNLGDIKLNYLGSY